MMYFISRVKHPLNCQILDDYIKKGNFVILEDYIYGIPKNSKIILISHRTVTLETLDILRNKVVGYFPNITVKFEYNNEYWYVDISTVTNQRHFLDILEKLKENSIVSQTKSISETRKRASAFLGDI